MAMENLTCWKWTKDESNTAWLGIDSPKQSMNVLSTVALDELQTCLQHIKDDPSINALVIHSIKPDSFIVGANIHEFAQFQTSEEVLAFTRKGQTVFNALAALKIVTVALITGHCLGGGLELALACKYRVAKNDTTIKLGLPEVKLGLVPAWGGILRLARLIGAWQAIPLIIVGKHVDVKTAQKKGIIHISAPERQLKQVVKHVISYGGETNHHTLISRLSNIFPFRNLLPRIWEYYLRKKANSNFYPAPYKTIEIWEKNATNPLELAHADSLEAIHYLTQEHQTARNLIGIFLTREKLRARVKQISRNLKHIHIIGAGVMGGNIAILCAEHGMRVTLQDRTPYLLTGAMQRVDRMLQSVRDRITPDVNGDGIYKAEVILEAINEKETDKRKLFSWIDSINKTALLATNTSSILIEDLAKELDNPARLVGIHFFNPVNKMPLVEVIRSKFVDEDFFNQAIYFVNQLDKVPVAVKSSPGFLVNRLLWPYLLEAVIMIEEGVSTFLIDKALENFGMPMGPVELADQIGLDICLAVAENLTHHFGGEIPQRLIKSVEFGYYGKKAGKGFYSYHHNRAIKDVSDIPSVGEENIVDRILFRMLNEAFRCLEEKVIDNADELDASLVFGVGFAPFRGGLINYANTLGKKVLQQKFEHLCQQHGERFKPIDNWQQFIKN